MDIYRYSKLQNEEIRLVVLLPGDFDQDIKIVIDKADLETRIPSFHDSSRRRMGLRELADTLPPGWSTYETLEDDIYFYYEEDEGKNWRASWSHPEFGFDPSLYQRQEHTQGIKRPIYEALSYTWWSEKEPELAYIQDQQQRVSSQYILQIGGNLACALRHLRQRDKCRTLWIDAICIDQSNIREREEQVARMAQIYKSAHRVVVWLGDSNEEHNSGLALRTMDYMGKQMIITHDGWSFAAPDADEPHWCEARCPLPFQEDQWVAISSILRRPWFGRVWIIQEIQLANKFAILQCGHDQLLWSRFRNAISCLWVSATSSSWNARSKVTASSNVGYGRLQNKENLPSVLSRESISFVEYLATTNYRHTPVLHILHLTKGRGCTDKRDRVYGLLGLFPTAFQERIYPNYSLSAARAYIDLVVSSIQIEGSLAILRRCQLTLLAEHSLPSWVPDLSVIDKWSRPLEWLHAAGDSKADFEFLEPGLLQVTGLHYAIVSDAEDHTAWENSEERARKIFGFLELRAPCTEDEYQSGGSLDVFAKALVGGYLRDRFPDESLSSLEQWRTQVASQSFTSQLLQEPQDKHVLSFQERWAANLVRGRIFFRTHEGHIGLGSADIQQGSSHFHTTCRNSRSI